MKTWSVVAAVVLAAGIGFAQAGKAINTSCPIKGTAANGPTAVYKGKTIAFCCGNCLAQFKNDPDKVAAMLPEFAPVTGPTSLSSAKDALDGAKAGPKPAVIYFADAKNVPLNEGWLKALVEPTVTPELDKCTYFKIDFAKDEETAKKFKVTKGGTLVIIDARTDEQKVLKSLTAPNPKTIAKELADAFKKVTAAK
jgi:YHS domain-containing protein